MEKELNKIVENRYTIGEVLYFNKAKTWTSFDLVNKVRYLIRKELGVKKLKIGHAGTLDPLATGVMIVCTGKATKSFKVSAKAVTTPKKSGRICMGTGKVGGFCLNESNYVFTVKTK
jgi:tRNA U55 pseudouridine synthase TruB